MNSRNILSFISLIIIVNFHGDIFATRSSHNPAHNAQVEIQRCAMCKQQKPLKECAVTKFSIYCHACLQTNGIDVPTNTQQVDMSSTPAHEQQRACRYFNRKAIAGCAALITAVTYSIGKKIRNKFTKQVQNNQMEAKKVKQNEL